MTCGRSEDLLSVEAALDAVLSRARPLPSKRLPLTDALGLVLAEDVVADLDLPPFDKSLVDGYAVRAADLAAGMRTFRVVEEVPAGRVPIRPVGPRETALVMTGAPLPEGADAVVMLEQARRDGDHVTLDTPPLPPGRNRLSRGREMLAGDLLLRSGEILTPAALGLLASVGEVEPLVHPRPRLTVVPTGDELVEPDRRPGAGQIRNSNATVLRSLASQSGATAVAAAIAPDDPELLSRSLADAMGSDVVLITGGVSAGNRDLVPGVLESLGVTRVFHKIRLKPGKPLWFGVGRGSGEDVGPLVFGLPGNPVSGIVGFLLFVRPAIQALGGRREAAGAALEGRLARPFTHKGDRPTYHPSSWLANASGVGEVEPLDWAGSADLRTIARADGFAHFPAGERVHEAGEIVRFIPLR